MALDVTRDILTRNIGLKIIALLVSIMLWLYVISTDDPEVVREKILKYLSKVSMKELCMNFCRTRSKFL